MYMYARNIDDDGTWCFLCGLVLLIPSTYVRTNDMLHQAISYIAALLLPLASLRNLKFFLFYEHFQNLYGNRSPWKIHCSWKGPG